MQVLAAFCNVREQNCDERVSAVERGASFAFRANDPLDRRQTQLTERAGPVRPTSTIELLYLIWDQTLE